MTIYTVHKRPADPPDKIVLVAEGYSWLAFVFTAFWAVSKGLWLVTLVLLSILVLGSFAGRVFQLGDVSMAALQLAISAIFGFEARNLQRWTLRRRGYDEIAVVSGRTVPEAELAYFCGARTSAGQAGPAALQDLSGIPGRA